MRWNARINLTAIRNPEEIVTRHFGESLFCATQLAQRGLLRKGSSLIDIGSGAGFPGLPIKIFAPEISLALIESNNKKVAFLREVIRTLDLKDTQVFAGRAEEFVPGAPGSIVTLRAVERFADVLPHAVRLACPEGSLALLIGEAQAASARELAPEVHWQEAAAIPLSDNRVVVVGEF